MASIVQDVGADKVISSFVCKEEESKISTSGLVPEGWLLSPPQTPTDSTFHCIKIFQTENKPLAIAWITPAENSILKNFSGLPLSMFDRTILLQAVWVSPEAKGWAPALLYLALRRGRIWKDRQVVILADHHQAANFSLLRMQPVENIAAITLAGKQQIVYAQHLHYALHLCYQYCLGEQQQLINAEFSTEIIDTVQNFLRQFFSNKFSQAIFSGSLTKPQYIQCLFNTHSYVRYTTRLIARSIAFSDNFELRNHYIEHLKGEINHEKIIERDLKHLGADVDYLTKYYVPNLATKEFMITQESTIGFYQNPVLMLACPLAAEGITAVITKEFLEALRRTIQSWDVKQPEEAMRFISSHTNTDGGDDGHWENVKKMIRRLIHSETTLQQFLSVYEIAAEGLQRCYESCIVENQLWDKVLN